MNTIVMSTLYTLEDLKMIELKCPNEDEYKNPEQMRDSNNNALYAYATLVMLGDLYVSAALVLAHTLKKLNTEADLVVLVTSDVSENGKNLLREYFDRVIDVPFLEVVNWRVAKQPHRRYLNYVFTKFNIFNLTEYKKILLIDADAMVLKYPDHLFTLDTPAGVYLEDKRLFIYYDKDGNYVLPKNNKIKWYEEYCECCEHGKTIPKYITDRVEKNRNNSGIGGGLLLLKPDKAELKSIMQDVKHGSSKYLINKFFIWPEQQYLARRYSGKWHSINPVFFGLQGYPHWEVLYGLQFAGDKPFTTISKFSIEERAQYPDFIIWHRFYNDILKEHPEFLNNPALIEANAMNKQINKIDIKRIMNRQIPLNRMPTYKVNAKYIAQKLGINKN